VACGWGSVSLTATAPVGTGKTMPDVALAAAMLAVGAAPSKERRLPAICQMSTPAAATRNMAKPLAKVPNSRPPGGCARRGAGAAGTARRVMAISSARAWSCASSDSSSRARRRASG
jgi:hypothetical protein